MLTYILISLIYAGVFIAWMKTKQPDRYGNGNYSNECWDNPNGWSDLYILYFILGTLFWPIVITINIISKIAFKILNTINKNKK